MENQVRFQIAKRAILACGLLIGLPFIAVMPAYGQTVTRYTYDAGDHVIGITDPRGLTTTYTYDGLGQKWQQVSPDSGTTTYSYDAYGRLASMIRPGGNQVSYTYDSIERRTSASAGGLTQTFTYDNCTNGVGRLCAVSDVNSRTTYVYSPEGWITGRGFSVMGAGYSYGYAYNAMGQVTMVAYPDGNQALYTYANSAVSTVQVNINGVVSTVATGITYQPADAAMAQWTAGNGLTTTMTYDQDGRLHNLHVPGLQDWWYIYDQADRMTGLLTGVIPAMSQTFGYDTMSRLTSMQSGADSESFSYDANGNRQSQLLNGQSVNVTANGGNNQLIQLAGATNTSYGYDARGNLTTVNGATTFTYDPFNRLSAAGAATYVVGPEGQRLRKTYNGATTLFAPDPSGSLMAEDQYQGAGWIDYIWLNGRLIARLNAGQVQAIHGDHLGRPEFITDANRNIVWQAYNFAFDRSVVRDNAVSLNLGFPGQYYDKESGLWNNGYRDYSPSLGRYIESDPMGLAAGINTYAYVSGNPLSHVDPLGLDDTQCMYDPSSCGMSVGKSVYNVSLGLGAWGNLLGGFGSGEVGGDVDTTGTMCVHVQVCGGGIAGLPVQGEIGVTGGAGTGALCSGTQRTKGAFVIGGAGVAGGGQITGNDSGTSMSKGIVGIGGSPEGAAAGVGVLQCHTEYRCTK